MWEHYRKTFWRIQTVIWMVTACVYFFFGRLPARAAAFFVVMQISAAMGALWAARLRALVQNSKQRLPLSRRD